MNHHDALIYTMVLASAADSVMTDAEVERISTIVRHLPVFEDFDIETFGAVAADCAGLIKGEDGLDRVLGLIKEALPAKLRETAYAMACDVVAADLSASQEELRLLEMIRNRLEIERLAAAGIERGARARHARL